MLSKQDEARLLRARRSSPEYQRRLQMRIRLDKLRISAKEKQWLEDNAFRLWSLQHQFVTLLEQLRDANRPQDPDEPWNENFCTAVRMLPEEKEAERELWIRYESMKEGGE